MISINKVLVLYLSLTSVHEIYVSFEYALIINLLNLEMSFLIKSAGNVWSKLTYSRLGISPTAFYIHILRPYYTKLSPFLFFIAI